MGPAGRTDAGYRLYDDGALERLAFVARAKQLGCSLEEITAEYKRRFRQEAVLRVRTRARVQFAASRQPPTRLGRAALRPERGSRCTAQGV